VSRLARPDEDGKRESIQLRQDFLKATASVTPSQETSGSSDILWNTGKITAIGWLVFSWDNTAAAAFLTSCSAAEDLAGSLAQPRVGGSCAAIAEKIRDLRRPSNRFMLVAQIILHPFLWCLPYCSSRNGGTDSG